MVDGMWILDWDSPFAGDGRFTLSYIEAVGVETSVLVSEHVGPANELSFGLVC